VAVSFVVTELCTFVRKIEKLKILQYCAWFFSTTALLILLGCGANESSFEGLENALSTDAVSLLVIKLSMFEKWRK
jgi:hypothetical protein